MYFESILIIQHIILIVPNCERLKSYIKKTVIGICIFVPISTLKQYTIFFTYIFVI